MKIDKRIIKQLPQIAVQSLVEDASTVPPGQGKVVYVSHEDSIYMVAVTHQEIAAFPLPQSMEGYIDLKI